MLTRKQHDLLLYIHKCLKSEGISPSFDEMKDALGLRSKSGIHRLITALEERGFIRRLPHRARALEVLHLPGDMAPAEMATNGGFQPSIVSTIAPDKRLSGQPVAASVENISLPLYGRIAAGSPIEALRDHNQTIDMPASMLGAGEHYALEIEGDSMIDAGIHDGDTAIIQRCDTADNGAIVVALVDDNEVTLKRLRRHGASVALEPANTAFETRIFPADRVKIQGRLVCLMRKY
jgi:repressor LexA